MNNKEMLKQEEEKMQVMYSGEPCHLIKGMLVALGIEAVVFGLIWLVCYFLIQL